jgi:hypothetical protein
MRSDIEHLLTPGSAGSQRREDIAAAAPKMGQVPP